MAKFLASPARLRIWQISTFCRCVIRCRAQIGLEVCGVCCMDPSLRGRRSHLSVLLAIALFDRFFENISAITSRRKKYIRKKWSQMRGCQKVATFISSNAHASSPAVLQPLSSKVCAPVDGFYRMGIWSNMESLWYSGVGLAVE